MDWRYIIYIFIICVLTLVTVSIANLYNNQANKSNRESIHAPINHGVADGYSTIVIDSCEYIEAFNKLTHKGNCKFCVTRHRKERQDLIKQLNK